MRETMRRSQVSALSFTHLCKRTTSAVWPVVYCRPFLVALWESVNFKSKWKILPPSYTQGSGGGDFKRRQNSTRQNSTPTRGRLNSDRVDLTLTRVALTSSKRDFPQSGKMLNCFGLPRVSKETTLSQYIKPLFSVLKRRNFLSGHV